MRTLCAIVLVSCVVVLSGCAAVPVLTTSSTQPNPVQGTALRGRVHGGQQPIVGASVYLYAVDATGDVVQAVESPLANALEHVVEKTKAIVDFLDEAAEVGIIATP